MLLLQEVGNRKLLRMAYVVSLRHVAKNFYKVLSLFQVYTCLNHPKLQCLDWDELGADWVGRAFLGEGIS